MSLLALFAAFFAVGHAGFAQGSVDVTSLKLPPQSVVSVFFLVTLP